MTTLTDRSIATLRRLHDRLAARVPSLTDEDLARTSGAEEWPLAQVLSHLGSAAEIARAAYRAALDGSEPPGPDFNQQVWDRWNALDRRAQADAYVGSDAALVELLESLTDRQRAELTVRSFLPDPLPLETMVGMRLSEVAQHTWDAEVTLDPAATLDGEAGELLVRHYAAGLGFLLGFVGKADAVAGPAVVEMAGSGLAFVIADRVELTASAPAATATLTAAPESVIRLIGGRLKPDHTPDAVAVTGNVTLDDLRAVFPGY
ncbi:MAG: maleylpyruvate isomerase N-terminal domain-containing protein [Nocardioidaceae bacterium]